MQAETRPKRSLKRRRAFVAAVIAVGVAACGSNDGDSSDTTSTQAPIPTSVAPSSTSEAAVSVVPTTISSATAAPSTSEAAADTTTLAPTTAAEVGASTVPPTSVAVTTTTAVTTTMPPPAAPTTEAIGTVRYVVPVTPADRAGWGNTHSSYPATDIFLGGCGATIVSPTDGSVIEVRTVDEWDSAIDNPATRGGRSVAILGRDGVRYYLAHFETIADWVIPGASVTAGVPIGTIGTTGRSSACHVHFAISPPCPGPEWSVRRGVIWPYPYLNDWRGGGQRSPVDEVNAFVAANPTACADAMADPFAADAAG